MDFEHPDIDSLLRAALDEDVGTGDVTTNCCVPESAISKGTFVAKEPGVISGIGILQRVFNLLDETVAVTTLVCDGDAVKKGDVIAEISGNTRAILTGERTALNLLQHMSGIATRTSEAVREVNGTKTKILDTRKTTPGFRALDKYAVKCGGGTNHRFNLTDGVLIKDNHIKAAGGITSAVQNVHNGMAEGQPRLPVEVETENIEQVKEALDAGVDIIMLDNMPTELMAEAVRLINGRVLTEASGNMGERNLNDIVKAGVDFISIGALTHSVKALDISLKLE